MKFLGRILLKGLVAILPISLSVYFVYWFAVTTESLLSRLIMLVIPARLYWPGLGLITGFVLLFAVGLALNAFIVRRVLLFGESLVLRVPVVKTVYAAVRDMTRLVNTDGVERDLQRVVMLQYGPGRVIGFVTQERAAIPGLATNEELVAVYVPLSFAIGGYTFFVPRSRIEATSYTVEAGMRIALTGGLQGR